MRTIVMITATVVAARDASADSPLDGGAGRRPWSTTLTLQAAGEEPGPPMLFGELARTVGTRWSAGARAMAVVLLPISELPISVVPHVSVQLSRTTTIELEATLAAPRTGTPGDVTAMLWLKRS